MPFTKDNAQRWGKYGGETTKKRAKANPDYYATIGKIGGDTTSKLLGRAHYSSIGKMHKKVR